MMNLQIEDKHSSSVDIASEGKRPPKAPLRQLPSAVPSSLERIPLYCLCWPGYNAESKVQNKRQYITPRWVVCNKINVPLPPRIMISRVAVDFWCVSHTKRCHFPACKTSVDVPYHSVIKSTVKPKIIPHLGVWIILAVTVYWCNFEITGDNSNRDLQTSERTLCKFLQTPSPLICNMPLLCFKPKSQVQGNEWKSRQIWALLEKSNSQVS